MIDPSGGGDELRPVSTVAAMKIILILTVAAAMLVATASAQAAEPTATPKAATPQIIHCLQQGGALKIKRATKTAYFAPPFSFLGRWVSWSYITSKSWNPSGPNTILGTMTVHGQLTTAERHLINRCLKPFNGTV